MKIRKVLSIIGAAVLVTVITTVTVFAAGGNSLESAALKLGINTSGMTNDQIKKALAQDGGNGSVNSVAKDMGFDTTGMTDDQIKQAVIVKDLGIDTTGMTDSQIKQAIIEKSKSMKLDSSVQTEKEPITSERIHEKLLTVAKEWGIDTTGMSDEQIDNALTAEKAKRSK